MYETLEIKIPKLKIVKDLNIETKAKIEKIITETIDCNHIMAYSIEQFTIAELAILAEYAKENDLLITIHAEHSSFHQGVLVQLLKRNLMFEFSRYL